MKLERETARGSRRLVRVAAVLSVGLMMSGCTSPDTAPVASAPPSATAPSSAPPSSATRTAAPRAGDPSSNTGRATATPPVSSAPKATSADTLTIEITIKDGKVTPSGKKFDVTRGQTIELIVVSDSVDEIHAHNGGDGHELAVEAGGTASGSFVAADIGSFDVESHELEKVIAILNVR